MAWKYSEWVLRVVGKVRPHYNRKGIFSIKITAHYKYFFRYVQNTKYLQKFAFRRASFQDIWNGNTWVTIGEMGIITTTTDGNAKSVSWHSF